MEKVEALNLLRNWEVRWGVLEVRSSGAPGIFDVTFSSALKLPKKIRIHGALLGNEIHTPVKSGENSGKTLGQDFLVLDLKKGFLKLNQGKYTGRVSLNMAPVKKVASRSVAFWVTQMENGELIQAVGGDLVKKGKI